MGDQEPTFKCTNCHLIPDKEVFECLGGHLICSSCINLTETCSSCGVSVVGDENRTRTRALENFLDKQTFPCPNQRSGCEEKLKREHLRIHCKDNCRFGGTELNLCSFIWGDFCSFRVHSRKLASSLDHFQNQHAIQVVKSSAADIFYQDFAKALDAFKSTRYVGTPVILRLANNPNSAFIIVPITTSYKASSKTCSWMSIFLGDDGDSERPTQVEYSIKSQSPQKIPLKWTTCALPLEISTSFLEAPVFSLPWKLLKGYCNKDGDLLLEVRIKGSESVAGSLEASLVQVEMPIEMIQEADILNISNNFKCNSCSKEIVSEIHYLCLRCTGTTFILCESCMVERSTHTEHVFARIHDDKERNATLKFLAQNKALRQKKSENMQRFASYRSLPSSGSTQKRAKPAGTRKSAQVAVVFENSICVECKESIISSIYMCLQCDFVLCSECAERGVHAEHILCLVQTVIAKQVIDNGKKPILDKKLMKSIEGKIGKAPLEMIQDGILKFLLISCNECGMEPIVGMHYKCLNCKAEYYLCPNCVHNGTHPEHILALVREAQFVVMSLVQEKRGMGEILYAS